MRSDTETAKQNTANSTVLVVAGRPVVSPSGRSEHTLSQLLHLDQVQHGIRRRQLGPGLSYSNLLRRRSSQVLGNCGRIYGTDVCAFRERAERPWWMNGFEGFTTNSDVSSLYYESWPTVVMKEHWGDVRDLRGILSSLLHQRTNPSWMSIYDICGIVNLSVYQDPARFPRVVSRELVPRDEA